MRRILLGLALLAAWGGVAKSSDFKSENLALGKPVMLIPNANYPETTDAEDDRQLTDGRFTESPIWRHASTVGWVYAFPRAVVDLGAVAPIEKIVVTAAGGGLAGVKYPAEIVCYVSDDNIRFSEVARLTPSGLKESGREAQTHAFTADGLRTRGRYVFVTVEMSCSMAFLDEIEIWRGDFDPQEVALHPPFRSRESLASEGLGTEPNSYTRGHFPASSHVRWSLPLSGGSIPGILMNFSDGMRDVAEIAQRLDLDYAPVSHWSYYRPEPLQSLSVEKIEQALPGCRVMVVGAMQWQAFPKELLAKIKERIRSGMGLVCVTTGAADWLKPIQELFAETPLEGDQGILDNVPMPRIPGYHKPQKSHFRLSQYGQGRVALVNPADFTRMAHTILPQFLLADYVDETNGPLEYYFLALNKLVLWAAQWNAPRQIEAISASPEDIAVRVKPGSTPAELEVVVRDPFFRPLGTQKSPVSDEGGTTHFRVPSGARGVHGVDVWLRDAQGKILDTGSASFDRKTGARIVRVAPSKLFWAAGETLTGEVEIADAPPDSTLRVALYDTNNRLVAPVLETPLGKSLTQTFHLPYSAPQTLAAKLFVEVWHDGQLRDRQLTRLWVDVPPRDDFTFLGWYALSYQPAAEFCMRLLRNLGVDGYVSLPTLAKAENGAYGNVPLAPEEIAFVRPPPEEDVGVMVPDKESKTMTKLSQMAREWRPFGVVHWSLGDEERLGTEDTPPGQALLAIFQDHLKKQFPSLEKLNESWKTPYRTWEEIRPPTLQEVKAGAPLSAWIAYRRFLESRFADYHAKGRAAITAHIPRAWVGLSGTQEPNSFNGYDWWKLSQSVDHVSGYVGLQPDLQRSFLKPGAFSTTFLGYDYADNNEQLARGRPWDLLFNAARGINFYTLVSHTLNCPLLRSDLSMTRQGAWFFEELAELKRGIGKLFMEADYANDGIAIHYSPASLHAATASGLFQATDQSRNYWANVACLARILRDTHYQFDFLHEDQMAEGALSRYKVLILPWSSAISPKEATAIRQFVKNGGTVIADSYCGIRNAQGVPEPVLDDVFGIRQPLTPPSLFPVKLKITSGPLASEAEIPVTKGVSRMAVTDGVAQATAGSEPAVISHPYGKGHAFFLNANFSTYAWTIAGGIAGEVQVGGEGNADARRAIQRFFRSLLTEAGIRLPTQVILEDKEAANVLVSRFTLGDAMLLGVLWPGVSGPVHPQTTQAALLRVPESHIYDSRSGEYLGKSDTIHPQLIQGIAKAYALLPYRVEKLKIHPDRSSLKAGDPGHFSVSVRADGECTKHVFHLSVRDPSGNERPEYAGNWVGPKGKARVSIPFAYNDPLGSWEIAVRDVATGIASKTTVTLTQPGADETSQ